MCHEPLSNLMKTYPPAPDAPEDLNMMQQPSRSPWAAHLLEPADHVGPLQVLLELEGSQLPQTPCYLERQPVIRAGHRSYLVQWLHRVRSRRHPAKYLSLGTSAAALILLDESIDSNPGATPQACFSLKLELSAFALAVRLLDRFLEVCMVQVSCHRR